MWSEKNMVNELPSEAIGERVGGYFIDSLKSLISDSMAG